MIAINSWHHCRAVTLSNTLYLLALNPSAQDKLIAEVDNYLYENDQEIHYDSLMDLKYMEAVIKETLRLMPTFPRGGRVVSRDCRLGNVFLPKGGYCCYARTVNYFDLGAIVWISHYAIQNDEANFECADEFIPERWLDGNSMSQLRS